MQPYWLYSGDVSVRAALGVQNSFGVGRGVVLHVLTEPTSATASSIDKKTAKPHCHCALHG